MANTADPGLNTSPSAPPLASPSTNVQPPLNPGASNFQPPDAASPPTNAYPPPPARASSPPRSRSQPAPTGRKSVQFAEAPEVATLGDTAPGDSEASSPERHRHRHKHTNSGGYEAEEDTDSTPEELRRRSREQSSQSLDLGGSPERKHHRRRRSHEPTSSRGEPSSSYKGLRLERVSSPNDSDATIELPPRFDEKGRRKTEGEDPLADKLEEILAGKGAAGKMFGNFLDGLFGPDGPRRKGR